MSCIIAIVVLAVGASANADDYTRDKMVNRAKLEENLEKDLDETVLAKDGGKDPAPKKAPAPKKKTWSWGQADKVAKELGLEFDPNSFFRAASPKILNKELAPGETGLFGEKSKWYGEDPNKVKALPGAPVPLYDPYMQRGFAPQASMKMPNTVRAPRVQAARFRAPFLASVDATCVAGAAMIAFFAGCSVAYFFHLRSRSTVAMAQ